MKRSVRPCPLAACLLGLLLTLACGFRVAAGLPEVRDTADPQITAPEVAAHVRYLASDELQGRGTGTRGNDLAAEYIAERFRAAGLKPAGEDGSYFQSFTVFTGIRLGARNEIALRAGDRSLSLRPQDDFMPLPSSRNGTVTAPLAFVGYGISRPDLGYDDYAGIDVRGKIVLVLRRTPDGQDNGKFAADAPLTYKTMAARQKGAAGVLFLTGPLTDRPEDLGYFRLEGAAADSGIPAAIVRRRFVEELLAPRSLRDLQVAMAHGKPQSFDLPEARATMRIEVVRQRARTRNVLGLVESRDPRLRREVVVIGAHYDHLGLGGSHSLAGGASPAIHYGADDNASGTAGLLELAEYFAARRAALGRSLLFIAFSGEEMGLLGSNHWTKKPTIPLERVAAMVNLDMIGRLRNDTVTVIGAGTSPAWAPLLEDVSRRHGIATRTGGSALSGIGGSDQQSFQAKGIPVLFFFTGLHADYHRPTDTWDKVDAEGEARLLRMVADAVERISRLESRPAFVKVTEPTPTTATGFNVYLGTIPDYAAEVQGVLLQGVREGSPAEKGGLRAGDIIVEFAGKQIRNVQEYSAALAACRPDVPVTVVVMREGRRLTLTVTPAARRG